jgi:type I restriction enzyme S subunit
LGQYSLSAAQPGLSVERIKVLSMPLPPLPEQINIASYLDTICTEIDSLIATKQQKIEELKEYKKSVIYEYVTGKKEVPYGE